MASGSEYSDADFIVQDSTFENSSEEEKSDIDLDSSPDELEVLSNDSGLGDKTQISGTITKINKSTRAVATRKKITLTLQPENGDPKQITLHESHVDNCNKLSVGEMVGFTDLKKCASLHGTLLVYTSTESTKVSKLPKCEPSTSGLCRNAAYTWPRGEKDSNKENYVFCRKPLAKKRKRSQTPQQVCSSSAPKDDRTPLRAVQGSYMPSRRLGLFQTPVDAGNDDSDDDEPLSYELQKQRRQGREKAGDNIDRDEDFWIYCSSSLKKATKEKRDEVLTKISAIIFEIGVDGKQQ